MTWLHNSLKLKKKKNLPQVIHKWASFVELAGVKIK